MTNRTRLELLQRLSIFEHLSANELEHLLPYCGQYQLEAGDVIIQEGDQTQQLYIILSGEVGVFKTVPSSTDDQLGLGAPAEQQIGTRRAGAIVGEMRFIDPIYPRSASVRALCPTEVLSISPDAFKTISQQHGETAYTFILNLFRVASQNLRKTSETTVTALQRELDYATTHAAMGRFISYIIILLFVYNLMLHFTIKWSKISHYANEVSFAIVAVFGLSLIFMIKQTGSPLRTYGITLHNWQRSVSESLAWTLGVLGGLTALKWLLIKTLPRYADLPLFGPYDTPLTLHLLVTYGLYTLLAPVQEFIARGVMQTSFEWFYTGKYRALLAILLSNSLFAAAHVHLSAIFAAVTFVLGLLWGYLYARQRTLIGVSLSHILIGLYGVFVLRFALMD